MTYIGAIQSRFDLCVCLPILLALMSVYPEHNWLFWRFTDTRSPLSFWKDTDNQKKYIEWLRAELKIQNLQDWLTIKIDDIAKVKGLFTLLI
jgi:hypothetical protein